jgi:hypothetical protein
MNVLSRHTSSKLKQRIHCFESISNDRSQLFPAAFPRIHDLAQWNRLAGQVGRYGSTKEPLAVEDPDLTHVPGIESDRDVLTDICCERERKIAKIVKVNAIGTDPPASDLVD